MRFTPAASVTAVLFCSGKLFPQQPIESLPHTPGLDTASMDKSVDPCQNFYLYACGSWIKDNPIPADQSRWDVYSKLQYENQTFLWGLLLQAGKTNVPRTADAQTTLPILEIPAQPLAMN